MTGLLAFGRRFTIDGLTILGPGDAPWIRLDARDYRARPPGTWLRQLVIHTTAGVWPHLLVPGAGPRGGAQRVASYWHTDPHGKAASGGAHLVVDEDGSVLCLADVGRIMAYHATTANAWSVGIEMCQRQDGRIYEATLAATVKLAAALCTGRGARELGTGAPWPGLRIPFQVPRHAYRNAPIERMRRRGGPDMAGVFGHRDVAWRFPAQLSAAQRKLYPGGFSDRGRGDPGDDVYRQLALAGAEPFDFDRREDLEAWRRRQVALNARGAELVVDGIPGPATMAAMSRLGLARGQDLDAAPDPFLLIA